jgi:hypothetical protein
MNDFKSYMQKLEQKVDRNYENTKHYLSNISNTSPFNHGLILKEVNRLTYENSMNNSINNPNTHSYENLGNPLNIYSNNERNERVNIR